MSCIYSKRLFLPEQDQRNEHSKPKPDRYTTKSSSRCSQEFESFTKRVLNLISSSDRLSTISFMPLCSSPFKLRLIDKLRVIVLLSNRDCKLLNALEQNHSISSDIKWSSEFRNEEAQSLKVLYQDNRYHASGSELRSTKLSSSDLTKWIIRNT